MTTSEVAALRGPLDAWRSAIDRYAPEDVAAVFTEDAVFQGLRPYTVGRPGVAAYYASQPPEMTVSYRILESRRLAPDVVLGWVAADFSFPGLDRAPVLVNLTVVVRRDGDAWRIAHYHVSPRIAEDRLQQPAGLLELPDRGGDPAPLGGQVGP
ncbi:SgcJ/EcaC family oxidoreductase [Actinoplanes sp. NPDC024001]|uniref:SgcJ/EcaC family oxidoreductase n=1 Tax=Actinoplanes sp. NPDC024001 TaxID=3154598 RepID=UPI0033C9EE1A